MSYSSIVNYYRVCLNGMEDSYSDNRMEWVFKKGNKRNLWSDERSQLIVNFNHIFRCDLGLDSFVNISKWNILSNKRVTKQI